MRVDSLVLEGFRNYELSSAGFDPGINVITGENAQGKTNLLEAVYMLTCGRSFRTRFDRELIGFSAPFARIDASIFAQERQQSIEISMLPGRKKILKANGSKINGAGLTEIISAVLFCPDDLYVIREGASARRRLMDMAISQLRPGYQGLISAYSRLLEHKTRILRDSEEHPQLLEMLPEFNERLCRVGAVLIGYRARFCASLAEYARQAHLECSGEREELTLSYQTVRTVEDTFAPQENIYQALRRHQEAHLAAERASRLCLSGPHKDDVEVLINGRSARQYGSQGQVRTAALSLKLAEREIHKNAAGEYPVMLLDDVLSELDPRRQEYVLNRIRGGQVFITCCENDRLDTMLRGRVFHIRDGEVL